MGLEEGGEFSFPHQDPPHGSRTPSGLNWDRVIKGQKAKEVVDSRQRYEEGEYFNKGRKMLAKDDKTTKDRKSRRGERGLKKKKKGHTEQKA